MKILALDLGTRTGFAIASTADNAMLSGTWHFQPSRYDSSGMRFVKFRARLQETVESIRPDLVAYEEVRRHVGTSAAHVYGGLVAMLQTYCQEASIDYIAVPVATIKKHFTGKGNADKAKMIAVARSLGFNPADDNEADAIALVRYALVEYGIKEYT
jgi:Holliday junction resolvasome RuvABC endonuclease subunit